jgi:RNA polymerase sigma-70 factor (ECF subfamily)
MPDWQELIDRDGPAVWATAYRLLGNRADADECFQEALLAALEVSRREEVQHWRALLQRLTTARAVDRLRQRRRRKISERLTDWASLRDPTALPAQEAEDAELSERLRAALAQIPAKQAQVFCLHGLEDWSYQEIARHLAISTDSVGVLLHRARRRLRQLLDSSPEVPRISGRGPAVVGPVPPSLREEPP